MIIIAADTAWPSVLISADVSSRLSWLRPGVVSFQWTTLCGEWWSALSSSLLSTLAFWFSGLSYLCDYVLTYLRVALLYLVALKCSFFICKNKPHRCHEVLAVVMVLPTDLRFHKAGNEACSDYSVGSFVCIIESHICFTTVPRNHLVAVGPPLLFISTLIISGSHL